MKVNTIKEITRKTILKETGAHYVRIDSILFDYEYEAESVHDIDIHGQYGFMDSDGKVTNSVDFLVTANSDELTKKALPYVIRGYIRAVDIHGEDWK